MKRLVRLCSISLALAVGCAGLFAAASASAEPYVYQGGEEEASPGNLFVGDGEEFQELPIYGGTPSLAPDGKRIVFYDEEFEHEGLAITDLEGHGPHLIFPPTVELYANYEWAPDGSEVLASSSSIASSGTIVSLHPSSTSTEWEVTTILPWKGEAFEPTVSPNGSKIAFTSFHDATGKALGNPAIFIANRNGTGVEQLTSPPAYAALNPSFSPDSSKIVFDGESEGAKHIDIFSITIETKAVTNLTNTHYR
jgi:Tol biopolymer transport system component